MACETLATDPYLVQSCNTNYAPSLPKFWLFEPEKEINMSRYRSLRVTHLRTSIIFKQFAELEIQAPMEISFSKITMSKLTYILLG